ncbi:unnamed protein product [Caenorhabditis angaria]|uniref:Kinesin motor domain-containing protein n=1 Tax=Caenorhabditis angaria TaxID=860376 RepID=A0A9P1IXY0_9PELO|nr:unnamed protein product [Caenorhabditis angaria]
MEACSSSSSLNSTTKSPLRTIPKIRICANVSQEDLNTKRCQLSENQQNLCVEGKNYSRGVFDHVFWPDSSQDDISHAFLHDTIKSVVLQGNDATILSMGSKSAGKDERLYGENIGGSTSRNGLVQIAITQLMTLLEEMRSDEERVQVRMSAIMISQHDSTILDLLSPFNPDPRHRIVRFVDDLRTGVYIDNESEIRVESIDQALFYLNTAVDHRLIQDEATHRTCHVYISLSVYSHNLSETEKSGGRRRLCFLDMGIGDRNSMDKGITMPGLGSILLAMVQRNKHVPLRETTTCQLIRCALSSSRFTTFLFSFGSRNDDNENIAHLACKIARTRLKNAFGGSNSTLLKNKKHLNNNSSEASSSDTTSRNRRDLESGSEFSAAETVIYLGPSTSSVPSTPTRALHRTSRTNSQTNISLAGSGAEDLTKPLSIETKSSPTHSIPPMLKGHTPFFSNSLKLYDELCSPPGTSKTSPNAFGGVSLEDRDDFGIMIAEAPKTPSSIASSKQKKYNLDDGKRKQIMKWMEGSESPPVLYTTPCYDQNWEETGGILSHPLEDIIEQEEESMKTSSGSKKDHPLRILSRQNLAEEKKEGSSDETELELVMAASLSSMKSHDILAKLEALRNTASGVSLNTTSDENASEMAVYRRASQLEEYAMLRVKEIEENKLKGKKKKLGGLNCCQIQSMVSSGSTVVDWSQIEKKKEQEKCAQEEEQRKEALRERRARLKITELEIKRERSLIDKELDDKRGLANSIARQLQHFSLSPCRSGPKHLRSSSSSTQHHRIDPPMCSLPSTPTMSHRKISEQKRSMQSSNNSLPRHHSRRKSSADKLPPTSERKSSKDRRTRTNSNSKDDELLWRSPYSHMTSPKTYGGPGTSSSGRGSSVPGSDFEHNATSSSIVPGTEKRSKRQSYSASSGYESASNDYHCYTKSSIFDKVKNANEERMNFARQADQIRHRQRQLKKELEDAKRAIGQVDDVRVVNDHQNLNGLSRTTLIDTLLQENRILEKRLVACRNHSMLVTTFI